MIETDPVRFLIPLASATAAWLLVRGSPPLRRAIAGGLLVATAAGLVAHAGALLASDSPFGFDVGYVHNALWNLLEGRWTACDVVGQPILSIHAFLDLPLFVPFFLLGHPSWLNVGHLLLGAAAAVPAFLLAREVLGDREAALAFALVYLLLPSTSGFLLVECQPSIAGVPFLFLYLWLRERRRRTPAVLAAACAAFGYEPFIAAILVEGLAEIVRPRIDRRFGAAVAAAGALALGLFLLNRAGHPDLSGGRHYAALGGSPLGALRLALEDPAALARLVLLRGKIGLLVHLLLPLLFLPLLSPRSLAIALPEVALVLLADPGSDMYRIDGFYTHVATVAAVDGAIRAAARLGPRAGGAAPVASLVLLVAAGLQFSYVHTFLPRAPASAAAAARAEALPGLRVVPWDAVPEGATVLVERRGDVVRFPRRRVILADPFLSPRHHRLRAEGRLDAEFLALPPGAAPPGAAWSAAGRTAGLDLYRRSR